MTYQATIPGDFGEQEIPVGMVVPFTGDRVPVGWLLCDGSEHSIQSFPRLFSVIQYNFGGDGERFNVPDLRERSVVSVDLSGSSEIPDLATEELNLEEFEGEQKLSDFFSPVNSGSDSYHKSGTLTLGPFPGDATFFTGSLDLSENLGVDDDLEIQEVVDEPYFIKGDRFSGKQKYFPGEVLGTVEEDQYINFRVTNRFGNRSRVYGTSGTTARIQWSGGTYDLSKFFTYYKTNRFYHPADTLTIGPFNSTKTITVLDEFFADDNLEIQISWGTVQYPLGKNRTGEAHPPSITLAVLPEGRKISFRVLNGPKTTNATGFVHWRGIISSVTAYDPVTFSNVGGENTHQLTHAELASHHHYFRDYYHGESHSYDDYLTRDAFGNSNLGFPKGTDGSARNGYPSVSFWNRTGTSAWFLNDHRLDRIRGKHELDKQNGPWAITPFRNGKDGGNDQPHNNMPPYTAMQYIIKI